MMARGEGREGQWMQEVRKNRNIKWRISGFGAFVAFPSLQE